MRVSSTKVLVVLCLALVCASAKGSSQPKDEREVVVAIRSALPSTSSLSISLIANNHTYFVSSKLNAGALSDFLTLPIPTGSSTLAIIPLVTISNGPSNVTLSSRSLSAGTYEAVIGFVGKNSTVLNWTVVSRSQSLPQTDKALVRVAVLATHKDLSLWGTVSECYNCAYTRLWIEGRDSFTVDTDFSNTWELRRNNQSSSVIKSHLVSAAEYTLVVTDDELELITASAEPAAYWLPLVIAAISCVVLAILSIVLFKFILRLSVFDPCMREKPQPLLSENDIENIQAKSTPNARLSSLDTFRGFTMTWMIFVNYGAGGYWFLDHAAWNGLHVADLLFPWFIMIMGTSMALSYRFLERPGFIKRLPILYKLVRRSVILVALGLFLNGMSDFAQARVFGVLQRFGVTYFIVGLIIVFIPRVSRFVRSNSEEPSGPIKLLADILPYLYQWFVVLSLLALYLCIQFLLPVPGCPTGYLGPGGLADGGKHPNCTGGAHGYIDRLLVGDAHIYQTPTCGEIYQTGPYDPEGTLGYLTSVLMAFLGLQAGRILTNYSSHRDRIFRWGIWGALCGAIALMLSGGTQNGGVIPINKNLWSPSFIFATSSLGFFLLIICYVLVDVISIWSGAPFIFVGLNPILIYCSHGILQEYFPFSFVNDGSHSMVLLSNLIGVASWLVIAYRMHQLKFYVKI